MDRATVRRVSVLGATGATPRTFCRAESVTGQVLVVDGGLAFH
jgi:hypothetical protein